MWHITTRGVALGLLLSTAALATDGPVAAWDFDEGQGDRITDRAGTSHGVIHGAAWIPDGKGYALQFDGIDDYVDCGEDPRLNLKGPLTLEAWVHPDRISRGEPGILGKFFESYALTYYQGSCYLYISSGGNKVFGAIPVGRWSHVTGVFDGKLMHLYQNGREVQTTPSTILETRRGRHFTMGCVIGEPDNRDVALRNTTFFAGKIDSVRVYDRPLSSREVILNYNRQARERGLAAFDPDRLERLTLQEFLYPEARKLIVRVDFAPLKPLAERARIVGRLLGPGLPPTGRSLTIEPAPRGSVETEFSLEGCGVGDYTVQAAVVDPAGKESFAATRRFHLPVEQPMLASPTEKPVPSLPPGITPPPFQVRVTPRGGITVQVGTTEFPVESSLSYPNGGENTLVVRDSVPEGGETTWNVKITPGNNASHTIEAEGTHYRLVRRLKTTPTRVLIEDTFTNKTDDVLGIIISNHIDTRKLRGGVAAAHPNATVFVHNGAAGLGLLAIDDLYHVHCETTNTDGVAALRDAHFGLDKGASYTFTWAIYPTARPRYFDFVNQVRKDEGLNGHVEGGLALSGSWETLSAADVRNKNLKYYAGASLTRVKSNPLISLEGWEYMTYPDVRKRLIEWFAANRKAWPDLRIMIHVAHSLYLTNKPRELFPDSLAVDENGNPDHYGPNTFEYHGSYISKELYDEGWRWWLFYPTMDNSFGKRMLEATDVMIQEFGANAMWADGFIEGYIKSGYTYDRWDGHSVTIDPRTKRVLRKKGNVTYLALPVLKEVVRRFDKAGGVVITNGRSGPLSFVRMRNLVTSNETGGGDQQPVSGLYLGRTVTPLGNPTVIQSPEDIWTDILTKLDLGALYFWYGEREYVTEPTIVSHMYPITFEAIDEGVVKGRERIITRHTGVYGWPGDKCLHAIYAYDGRGKLRPNHFITAIEPGGVRTQLQLGENEAAVVERLPIVTRAATPIHALVEQADASGVRLRVNGQGELQLTLLQGVWPFVSDTTTQATLNGRPLNLRREESGVSCTVQVEGEMRIEILSPDRPRR